MTGNMTKHISVIFQNVRVLTDTQTAHEFEGNLHLNVPKN